MKVQHYTETDMQPVEMPGARGCHVRWLIGKQDGAPTFAMRQFEVEPGGHSPRHSHPYEHEVFVLEGRGEVWENETPRPIQAGDIVFVRPDEIHQFRNTGQAPLKFLCLIPNSAMDKPVQLAPECGSE